MRLRGFKCEAKLIERISMPKDEGRRAKDGNELPTKRQHRKFVPTVSARVAALKMLARRELSEAQVRQRLARRGYDESEIETALERLKTDRAIDDARVAGAVAKTETAGKRGGRRARAARRAG